MSDPLQLHYENTVLHIQDCLLDRVPRPFRRRLDPNEVTVIARDLAEGARMAAAEVQATSDCDCGDEFRPGYQHVVGGPCYPITEVAR